MIWILLKLLFSRWLTIKRWSNFPRIEDITPLDNTWFVMHIALFLAYIEEKAWKSVDKEYIIKRVLFDLFKSLVLADINSGTRDYINSVDADIMLKMEKKVQEYLFSFEWNSFIKEDMEKVLSAKDKKLEDSIILAAKKYAWYNECLVNSRVFLYTYDVAMDQIMAYLDENKTKLYSLWELMKNDDYKKYLWHIRRLSHCKRWSWKNRDYEVSVMSHLVIVTFISYALWNIENLENWKDYNILTLMMKSLYHDIPEAITWDIITPIKESVDDFRDVLEKVEALMLNDYFFIHIPKDYKDSIIPYMLSPFEWLSWELTKKADIISAMYEAKIEKDLWNREFDSIYRSIKKIVNNFTTSSTDYFLKDIIMWFEEDFWEINLKNI